MASTSSPSMNNVTSGLNHHPNTSPFSGVTPDNSDPMSSYAPFPSSTDLISPQFQKMNMSAPHLQVPVPSSALLDDGERPMTATSVDTFQQAQTLFHDFDGTHYASSILDTSTFPIPRPRYAPPAAGMVYYPAPVPMKLNLPKRLSMVTPQQLEARRRSQILGSMNPEARKSAVWIKDDQSTSSEPGQLRTKDQQNQRMSTMSFAPPQLRASVFFERPGLGQDVEIKDQSATLTLEDLLDASAAAPVSAFTGHMFDPNASKIYKREKTERRQASMPMIDISHEKKRRSSFLGFGTRSMTTDNLINDEPSSKPWSKFSRSFSLGTRLEDMASSSRKASAGVESNPLSRSSTPAFLRAKNKDADAEGDGEVDEDPDFEMPSDDEEDGPNGPPTTLLAELQIRKQAQKSRNRTALSQFPNGLHTTLLELDAVAQIQKQKRQNTRVKLAWEGGPEGGPSQIGDDEDVPLGVLFADKGRVKEQLKMQGMAEPDRPLGLIELRELEDNEPLSFRRARLRGVDPFQEMQARAEEQLVERQQVEEMWDDGNAEETIAQRRERLRKEREAAEELQSRPVSKPVTEDPLQDPSTLDKDASTKNASAAAEEETLGQRKARLQKEARTRSMMSVSQMSLPNLPNMPVLAPQMGQRQPSANMSRENVGGLLKQSQDVQAARKEQIRSSTMRMPSGGSTYEIPGMMTPMNDMESSWNQGMDVNSMMLQQAQMLSMQNAQLASMMGLDFGMGVQMPPLQQMPMQIPVQSPMIPQMMPPMPQQFTNPYNAMNGGMPNMGMGPAGMGIPDFIDDQGRERIDAWRHTVQMD